jgi:hypothetical protein
MSRMGVLLAVAAIVGGVILAVTVGSIGGMLLVIGGVGALGLMALPDAIGMLARLLSTGSLSRPPPGSSSRASSPQRASSPLCRLGIHSWVDTRKRADGELYVTCRRCGAYGDEPGPGPFVG